MSRIGQQKTELLSSAARGALLLPVAAAALAFWMRGFAVDDAWIPIRYARHIASGAGYRFNVDGPVTDGVTPLVYPWLLAPFASGSAEAVLLRARVLGALAWIAAAVLLGISLWKRPAPRSDKVVAALAVALSVPVAAHAMTGLETGLATACATASACFLHRPLLAAAFAGAATGLRPELAPWAAAVGFGAGVLAARVQDRSAAGATARGVIVGALAIAPFFATALVRLIWFGRPAPLALAAKPSDLGHGLVYVVPAAAAAITPLLALAPIAIARARGPALILGSAAVAHALAVVLAGGDWMPYARLIAPIAPSLALVAVEAAPQASLLSRGARAVAALGLAAVMLVTAAPRGRGVVADRRALADAARPWLDGAQRIAALDIGWPSSVFEGTIVDLAGLTDPVVAVLPGGHTSKKVDAALLLDRNPDVLLFYAELSEQAGSLYDARYPRVVEARLAGDAILRAHFSPRAFLRLRGSVGYVVWKRTPGP